MDPWLNVLLAVTGSLQLGAVATRIAGRKHAALAMAGANAALALELTLLIFGAALASREKIGLRLPYLRRWKRLRQVRQPLDWRSGENQAGCFGRCGSGTS